MKFAYYGFNKSNSVAYSKIANQLSYLKANYPAHFFAPLLSSVRNEPGKLTAYIKEATDLGLDVLPPSINRRFGMYTVEKGHLRTGLMSIKGIGYETVKKIIVERR